MAERGVGPSDGVPHVDWEDILLVYMHDPVDKALDIRRHESRAARYASVALGRTVDRIEIKASASLADQLAAIAERIPMPSAGTGGERAAGLIDGALEIRHPISAAEAHLDGLAIDESAVAEIIRNIVRDLPDARSRFLALWRLLPERIEARLGTGFARLPADTRVPDHTIFHHADITSGLWSSQSGAHGGAYLSLSLGPVQPFIAAARTVRDLWSGSAILSWLVFQGIKPVLESLGPTALVFPLLRGNPLMDLWLRDAGLDRLVPMPAPEMRRAPSIPNRFVAVVPWGLDGEEASRLAEACETSARSAWDGLAEAVRNRLDPTLSELDPGWAAHWREQVESFFEIRTSVLPERELGDKKLARLVSGDGAFDAAWPDAAAVRGLADAIPRNERPGYDQHSAGRWQARLEVSSKLMEARRSVRHVPCVPIAHPSPPKCSLFGSFEQMGPDRIDDSRRFWEDAEKKIRLEGVRLRARERFSAVALCKRFAAPVTLARELRLNVSDLRFPDTATVAAASWLKEAGIDPDEIRRETRDWNGRWLHQAGREDVEEGEKPPPEKVWKRIEEAREKLPPPPSYYAVMMMDADEIGGWLRGECAPTVRECLHSRLRDYFTSLGESAAQGLSARRPVGPALHASISDALNSFATVTAPSHVSRFDGQLIYSGGDDTLALLPAGNAVRCTRALQEAFRGIGGAGDAGDTPPGWITLNGRGVLTMGEKASVSAGIAFVHVKEDLRLALQAARDAEAAAKAAGRDALVLNFMRRSGEHSRVLLEWDLCEWFLDLVSRFARGASDRWAYRLRAELPTLEGDAVPDAAVAAEIRRLVERGRSEGKEESGRIDGETAGTWWSDFVGYGSKRGMTRGKTLKAFTLLCQGASFIARGTDA